MDLELRKEIEAGDLGYMMGFLERGTPVFKKGTTRILYRGDGIIDTGTGKVNKRIVSWTLREEKILNVMRRHKYTSCGNPMV